MFEIEDIVTKNNADSEVKAFEKELPRCFIGNDGVLRRKNLDGIVQIYYGFKATLWFQTYLTDLKLYE